jgi:hypothetical protein
MLGGQYRVAPSASGQLVALVEQFVDVMISRQRGRRVDVAQFIGGELCTSACCTSRLARGNAQEQTHSETSSNFLCTNDELGNWRTPVGRMRWLKCRARVPIGQRLSPR